MLPSLTLLNKALRANQLSLSDEAKKKLVQYLGLLKKWNKHFNLTRLSDIPQLIDLHLIDSLIIAPYLEGTRLLDAGSGAGLPGLPLAILRPDQHWVLVDKNSKKTRFLTQVIAELDLKNVIVANTALQNFHPEQCFDTILSRAFGKLPVFLDATKHLIGPSGLFLAMKGRYPLEELREIPDSFMLTQVKRLAIKGMHQERHIVCIRQKRG